MRQGVKFEKPFWLFEVVKELEGVKKNVWGSGLRQKEDKLMDRKTDF